MSPRLLVLAPCLLLAACGGDDFTPPEPVPEPPADVAGTYSVAVVNHQNGCAFTNWTEGETTTSIPLTMFQNGAQVSGTIDGVAGAFFALWLGSNKLVGDVEGSSISLEIQGTNKLESNGCSYSVTAEVTGDLAGDAIQGEITYRALTDGSAACASLESCGSMQAFSGTRPPS